MSTLNDKLELIQQARDNMQTALAEQGQIVGKDIRGYAQAISNMKNLLRFYTIDEMNNYENAENNQVAAIIDLGDWWYSDSDTFYRTVRFVSKEYLGDDPFEGNTNFHSVTNFYDEQDTVIGTFDTTYNKLIADVTLPVDNSSYRYIVWWERTNEDVDWAHGGVWEKTKFVRIENNVEVEVENDVVYLDASIKHNWYSGDVGLYDVTSSFVERQLERYLEFYIYKWGSWERIGTQGLPLLFKNYWLWEEYRDNTDLSDMSGEELAIVFDNEYHKMYDEVPLYGASFPYWIYVDGPFSENPNDTFVYEGRDTNDNLCSTVTIDSTDVLIEIENIEDYDGGTVDYRIRYEYNAEETAWVRTEFVHIKDGEEKDDESYDDNVYFFKEIEWSLSSATTPDYYIVGQFVQYPSIPIYIDTYKFIYDDNPHWVSLLNENGCRKFETNQDMEEYQFAQEGDLAVVYRKEIQPINEESEFESCIFPNEVILNEAFTSSISGSFRSTGSSYFDGMVSMSSSKFRFNGYGESDDVRIQYTSSDGITYTRTDGGDELQEFGTTIKWEDYEPWNDVIGNFMKIGGNYFDGIYEYGEYVSGYVVNGYKDIVKENNIPVGTEFELDLSPYLDRIYEITSGISYTYLGIIKQNGHLYAIIPRYSNSGIRCYLVNNTLRVNSLNATNSTDSMILHCIDGGADTTLNIDTSVYRQLNNDKIYMSESFNTIEFLANIIIENNTIVSNISSQGMNTQVYLSTLENATNNETIISYTSGLNPIYSNNYLIASSQLDATADYVVSGKTFYGKNGVEGGTLTSNISSNFDDVNTEIFVKIQQQYDDMQPRVLTDNDKTIDTSILMVPCKTDGTSLLDTSSVTNMQSMFDGCKSLTIISSLDTSNVTTMQNMFNGCSNITTIPLLDTSNVTNMQNMFRDCTSLTTIPLLDTSNVTDMEGMFLHCYNLTTIPLLNTGNLNTSFNMFTNCTSLTTIPLLDTSSVTNMLHMFSYCTSLTTIPLLDTSNVTNMVSTFYCCTNLTNESLNNILAMCANATSMTSNKTLYKIGLSQEQATICQGLSNYSAFTSAGWTTGY